MNDTVVFIPAWNEENNLPAVLDELAADMPGVDVLVVDDGSTDATAQVASERGAIVVSFDENRGLRFGIAEGYRQALERGYTYCGRVDADGQHPVTEMARLLDLVRSGACDMAIGSRFAADDGLDDERYRLPAARRFGTSLLQRAMRIRLGRRFHDPTSGMAAANTDAMAQLCEPYASGAPEVEALLRMNAAGLRVDEVPVTMRQRAGGESKLHGHKAVELVVTVIATLLFFELLRRRRP